jgi:starvation-inducible outer membrane lipoprotein
MNTSMQKCMLVIIGSATLALGACTTVKEYQKNKLNDAEMSLGNRKAEKTELNFQSYREGSSGANGGKNGGGCGCN